MRRSSSSALQSMHEGANIDLTLVQVTRKAISDETVTKKAESENVIAESVSDQPVLSEKTVAEKVSKRRR